MARIAATLVLLFALWSAASAEPFDALGFSAEFPAPAIVHPEQDGARDAQGHVLSKAVLVQAGIAHVYSAVVVVETFQVPHRLDIDETLIADRDSCLKGWNATITASDPMVLDGHRALLFRYLGPGGRGGGAGIVAVVEADAPRIYVLFTMATPKADRKLVEALERMVGSFHITLIRIEQPPGLSPGR